MNQNIEILGLVAATLTTSSFGPQVYKAWKEKSIQGISLSMYTMLFVGLSLWVVYGLYLKSLPIILANGLTEFMVGIIIYFKLKAIT